jgi:PTH1 family peptidyl-tRNA hydrolase
MHLVVGLGNPGHEYEKNRHNIGFMAVDAFVHRYSFKPYRKKFQGLLTEGLVAGEKVLLLKPETYMNRSGQSVAEACKFYKIPIEHVIVLHDELDLGAGKIKIKIGGGHAGHNGLRDITAHLGANFKRVRLGIGHPGDKARVHSHVLGDFSKEEGKWLAPLLDAAADALPKLLQGHDAQFLNDIARMRTPQRPHKAPPQAKDAGTASAEKKPLSAAASPQQAPPKKPAETALADALRHAMQKKD